jgi:hypothetical protein
MKKFVTLVLVAILAVAVVFTTGCSKKSAIEPVPTTVPQSAEAPELDLSSVEETYTWPPRLTEGEEEPLMAEVDAIMRDNWENLQDYKSSHGDPAAEVELVYSWSPEGSISDVVVINLMVLADNGYTDYVARRIKELESYNVAFQKAGGELPEWAPSEVEDVKSYLK